MFISVKRHEREKQDLIDASKRLTDAILKSSAQGLFMLTAKDGIQPELSASMATLFRRQDFANFTFDKLISPLVTAKTLSAVRAFTARLLDTTVQVDPAQPNALEDVEVRLPKPDGTFETAHYSFDFHPVHPSSEPRAWLVRVTDITARVQQHRELEDLRAQLRTQGEILRTVLQAGGARFGAFLQRTDAAMKTINAVLKKPAREAEAFRGKLEETLEEVDRVRRDAAALRLTGLEAAARVLEDSLHELRSRGALSGSDFLPLAVKLDQLYGQFAQLRSLTAQSGPALDPDAETSESRMTDNGTQIIDAPKFLEEMAKKSPVLQKSASAQQPPVSKAHRMAPAGSLDSTLAALTELVAQEHKKTVVLECTGIELVPPRYQATIKNVAIQLIRNAVMHGVESSAARREAGKPQYGTLHLEFKALPDQSFELHFQDDGCGLDPEKVRSTAVARGLLTQDAAARLRDRQVIKLIFKSGYTTMTSAPGEAQHGSGMSLVRRYIHEAGGKIALATLLGHETRFKVTLPALSAAAVAADAQVA
ncbi:MAG TPA: ATP-binding protein [Steroidobacteraceae bacterium]|nr:ATP-binding protein [Steroidobacteraceae bacterium]